MRIYFIFQLLVLLFSFKSNSQNILLSANPRMLQVLPGKSIQFKIHSYSDATVDACVITRNNFPGKATITNPSNTLDKAILEVTSNSDAPIGTYWINLSLDLEGSEINDSVMITIIPENDSCKWTNFNARKGDKIVVDTNQQIWVEKGQVLSRYNGSNIIDYSLDSLGFKGGLDLLFCDSKNRLWISGKIFISNIIGAKLMVFDGTKFNTVREDISYIPLQLIEDSDKNILIREITYAHSSNINAPDSYSISRYKDNRLEEPFFTERIVDFAADDSGNVLYINEDSPYILHRLNWSSKISSQICVENFFQISQIEIDQKGFVWMGTMNGDILKYDYEKCEVWRQGNFTNEFQHYFKDISCQMDSTWGLEKTSPYKLVEEQLKKIYVSQDNSIWFQYSKVLLSVHEGDWTYYSSATSNMGSSELLDIYTDRKNNPYVTFTADPFAKLDCGAGLLATFGETKNISSFNIFPNPAKSDQITISTSQEFQQLIIFDISGKEIFRSAEKIYAKNETASFSLGNLPSGTYLVRLKIQRCRIKWESW